MNQSPLPVKQNGYKAPAVQKAFQLLRAVAESKQQFGLTELSHQLGYSKSTTHGLVHALLREGALSQDPRGRKLFLGPTITDLAFSSWNYLKLIEIAQPAIDDLRDQVHETVFFGAFIKKRILIMAIAEGSRPMKISASLGTTLPLFAGAAAKVLLARESSERIQELIREEGLPAYTSRSIIAEQDYLDEIQRVRSQGFAVDDEEYLTGIRAVAASLNNREGPALAIWIVGLSSTMGLNKIQQVADAAAVTVKSLRQSGKPFF
jgi:DNA-binding IclR family transcriptional regulator